MKAETTMKFPYLAAAALPALLDIRLKDGVEAQPEDVFPQEIAGGLWILKRHHNSGFCMNTLDDKPELVRLLTSGLFLCACRGYLRLLQKPGRKLQKTGWSLLLGGAADNLYDRLRRGYVVDYISLPFRKLRRVIFNPGDFMIFAGSGFLFLSYLTDHD